jgi:ABC-type sugar transport system permease subunit
MLKNKTAENFRNSFYIIPAMLLIGFVFLYPIYKVIYNSFFVNVLGTTTPGAEKFVGLQNFMFVFKDSLFWNSIFHNIILFFICVPILVFGSLVLSVLLFERIKGWQIYRTIVFIPYILPIVVVGISFSFMFQLYGVINTIFQSNIDWLGKSLPAFLVLVFTIVWKEIGFGVIIMLARLLSIEPTLLEAARIDGCNWWQLLVRIIIPQMKEVIYFYSVLSTIMVFTWLFNYVFVLTRGGPGTSTFILELYIYNQGFKYQNRGIASAVAVILLIIFIFVILIPEFRKISARRNKLNES